MKVIKPSFEILNTTSGEFLKNIERAGRTCYKSEDKITNESAPKFVKMILNRTHESVIEHESMSVRFICDRGVSHELVRHRLASFSQESTRYCNYTKGKFGSELTVIKPLFWDTDSKQYKIWYESMLTTEELYSKLINEGATAQEARSILPNSLKTEIVVTTNLRHWREIFKQRVSKAAHPQMRELMQPLLDEAKIKFPIVFDSINY